MKSIADKMSERMKAIAGLVTKGKKVADIGCDHAYISIFLIEKCIADRVIAADIRKGPLEIAGRNILRYLESQNEEGNDPGADFDGTKIETRLSNGFEKILPGETDAAVIAGMGGLLIVDILKHGERLFDEGYELVLSPQSEIYEVRKYLLENGFLIIAEKMLREEGKYYNIIKAVKCPENVALQNMSKDYSEAELTYGKIPVEAKDPVLYEKLSAELETNMKLIKALEGIEGEGASKRRAEIMNGIEMIKSVYEKMRPDL